MAACRSTTRSPRGEWVIAGRLARSVTLVIAVTGKKSIWIAADRRLSSKIQVRNNGCKILNVSAKGGEMLLAYAGLGATARNSEPSEWMKNILVGRGKLTIEQSLQVLAQGFLDEFPRHMRWMPGNKSHSVLAPALCDGKAQLYSIAFAIDQHKQVKVEILHHKNDNHGGRPPRIGLAGSGATRLLKKRDWQRTLLRHVARFERGRSQAEDVAKYLVELVRQVADEDQYVSKECVVAWHANGGAAYEYDASGTKVGLAQIPRVGSGMDINALIKAVSPFMIDQSEKLLRGEEAPTDFKGVQDAINRIPKASKKLD